MVQQSPHLPRSPHGSRLESRFERAAVWLACAGAAAACILALFACGTWWAGNWRMGVVESTIPTAPSTALLMTMLGATLWLHLTWTGKPALRRIGFVVAGLAAAPAIAMAVQYFSGFELAWENWLFHVNDTVRGIPVGRMSPLSAGAFLLAAISLAALLPPLAGHKWFRRAGALAAAVGEVMSMIVVLAYASGTPLFYDGSIIPMAYLTATAFAAIFLAPLVPALAGISRRSHNAGIAGFPAESSLPYTPLHLVLVFGALTLAIGLAGFFSLRVRQTSMRDRIAGELEAIAELKVGQIANWRNERLGDARLLMQSPLVRSATAIFANQDSAARDEMLTYIRTLLKNYPYHAVVLYDRRMTPQLTVPSTAVMAGPRLRALLELAATSTDPLLADLRRTASGGVYMDFVAPLREQPALPASPSVGTVLLRIDPRDFLYPLIQQWPIPSETGETLLVGRDGDEVVYLNDLRHQPGTALSPVRRSIHDERIPAVMGARGVFGVIEGVDYRGVPVLAAVRPVPNSSWVLVAKEDQSEIYAPLRRQALAMAGFVLALLLGAALGMVHLWRRTSANFLRDALAAETERRSLAERLALVTQHANDIILLADETGRIVEANHRALTTYGYTLEELRELPPGGLRAPMASAAASRLHALLDTPEGAIFETIHQRKNGSTFPVEVSSRSVEINGRRVRLGIFRDITERKRVEGMVRESERRFREMLENLDLIAITLDRTGVVTFCNDFLLRLLQRKREEVIGRVWFDQFLPDGGGGVRKMFEEIGTGRIPSHYENPILTRAGELRHIAWNNMVLRDGAGHIVGAASIGEDVTDRLRAEAALRRSEERYRLLFDTNPLPMWVYDLETLRFRAVNEAAVTHYGYTREEFLGMTIRDIRPTEDVAALLATIATRRADSGGTLSSRHRRKDGTVFPVELVSRPLDFDGRQSGLVLASDVTEKKLLQDQFLHAQRLENIGMLAAGIAHDLNNVLAPIVFAAPMLRDSLSSARDRQILDTLEQSAGRGAGLVRQILGFVHRTSDEFSLTQVKHLARDVSSVIEETFPKSIQFEHNIPSDLWLVLGNPTQIHQVILNLCVNARDAMPQGGTLRLTVSNRRLDALAAAAIPEARAGAWLVLEVADTGTGITPEVLKHIWTPFFTTKGEDKGTGLGLSTVRGIVASHHGFVELQTEVGRGSTFRVFLPASENATPPAPAASVPGDFDGHGELIMVVDDDAAVREMVSAILRRHGYRVVSCIDGLEALSVFNARLPEISLVLTDVDMPRLGGIALARAVVKLQPDIRLLAISGLSRHEDDDDAAPEIKKLAHAFLLKPFSPETLLGTVHQLLRSAEKPAEAPVLV